jgi:hypothetical protein
VPAATGGGTVLCCQLDLRSRVLATDRDYDPVAEQVLLNLILDRGETTK